MLNIIISFGISIILFYFHFIHRIQENMHTHSSKRKNIYIFSQFLPLGSYEITINNYIKQKEKKVFSNITFYKEKKKG